MKLGRPARRLKELRSSEDGVAMLEFALIAPIMVLIMIATYDLGSALNQYLALSRIAYEGTRYAATLPGLEQTTIESDSDTTTHNKVKDRVAALLIRGGFDNTETKIRTENQSNNWVKVTVTKEYRSIFGIFDRLKMSVSATGPFLSLKPTDA